VTFGAVALLIRFFPKILSCFAPLLGRDTIQLSQGLVVRHIGLFAFVGTLGRRELHLTYGWPAHRKEICYVRCLAMCVVAGEPTIHCEVTCQLATQRQPFLVPCVADASHAGDHTDVIHVGTRGGLGDQHIARLDHR
jgi:hypothetical protein